MASNIAVVLTLNNQQYLNNLNKAEQETKDFASTAETSVNKANDSFKRLNDGTGVLVTGMNRLKAAIAGVAFVGFARGALQMADGINDLSESTGIATDKIIGFQNAVKAAGGNVEGAAKGIQNLYLKIAEAAGGSAEAQLAFQQVGVTLDDLRNLSEADILAKTLEGLSKMGASAEKAAIQSDLLGKAMRGVTIDPAFVDALARGSEESQKLAERIREAARLNDEWEASVTRIRLAFIEAFGPALKLIAEMLDKIPSLTNAFKVLGVVIAGVFAATGLRAFVGILGSAVKAVKAISDGFKTITRSRVTGELVKRPMTPAERVQAGAAVAGGAGLIGGGAAAGAALFGADSENPAAARAEEAARAAQREAQQQREVKSAYEAKAAAVRASVESYKASIDAISENIDVETSLIGQARLTQDVTKTINDIRKREQDEIRRLTQAKQTMSDVDRQLGLGSVYDEQIAAVQRLARAEEQQATRSLELKEQARRADALNVFGINQQVAATRSLSDLQYQIATVNLPEMERRYAAIDKAARDAAEAQIASEEAARGGKLTDSERAAYYERAAVGADKLKQATQQLLDVELRRDAINFGLRQYVANQERVKDIIDDIRGSSLVGLEKAYFDIEAAANRAARAQIAQQAIKLGRDLSPEEQERYYAAARRGIEDVKAATRSAYEESRKFETGWRKAWQSYVDEATNAAKVSERIFNKAVQGMEDMIVNFVKTGKFEWKTFVASMAEELLRSQIKQAFANIMNTLSGAASSGQGGILGALGNLFGLGGGGGQRGQSATQPLYVYDVAGGGGAGGMFGGGGTNPLGGLFGGGIRNNPMIPGGGFGGGINQGGGFGSIFSGISGAIGSVVDTVSNIGSSLWDTVSNIGSSIGDLFGGFFADGGILGAGKWGIAGEAGPELIRGPASVTPMGGNVTYNINAVDAASFKAMIARDPGFIHAVAQQGAAYMPSRR